MDFRSKFSNGLNGSYGSLKNGVQVKVAGYPDNYVIERSFPLLVADNSYTMAYYLLKADDFTKGLYCPEAFLSLADTLVEVDTTHQLPDFFDSSMFPEKRGLGGCFDSFRGGSYVRLKTGDRIYSVVFSFLMLNSSSTSIICYELYDNKTGYVFYCPHSLLLRAYDFEYFKDERVTIFVPDGGGSSGGGGDNPPAIG